MTKILTGMFLMYLLNFTTYTVWISNFKNDMVPDIAYELNSDLNGHGIAHVITGRCRNIKGKHMTMREYFGCNKMQNLISDIIFGNKRED